MKQQVIRYVYDIRPCLINDPNPDTQRTDRTGFNQPHKSLIPIDLTLVMRVLIKGPLSWLCAPRKVIFQN